MQKGIGSLNLIRNRKSSWLIVAFGVLLTGCTAAQSAQPAPTDIPSTDQVSAPATVPAATEEPATATAPAPATAAPAASPIAATPVASAATPVAAAAEVVVRRLGRSASELAPRNDLVLHTITFQPGSSLTPHVHPGETIFYLESGSLVFVLLEGEAKLMRGANATSSPATPGPNDAVPIGVEIEVNAGDTLFYDESAVQTEGNVGTEDAVALVINQRGAEDPRIVPIRDSATPAATPLSGGTPIP